MVAVQCVLRLNCDQDWARNATVWKLTVRNLLGIFNPLNPADKPDQEPNRNTTVYRKLTIYVLGRIELVGRIVDAYSMTVRNGGAQF